MIQGLGCLEIGANAANIVDMSFPLHYSDPCQCGQDWEFWAETLTEKWLQNIARLLDEKFLCGLFLFDSLKSAFEPEEETIPWQLGSEFEENRINSPLQKPNRKGGKDLGVAMKQIYLMEAGRLAFPPSWPVSIPKQESSQHLTSSLGAQVPGEQDSHRAQSHFCLCVCPVPWEPKAVSWSPLAWEKFTHQRVLHHELAPACDTFRGRQKV